MVYLSHRGRIIEYKMASMDKGTQNCWIKFQRTIGDKGLLRIEIGTYQVKCMFTWVSIVVAHKILELCGPVDMLSIGDATCQRSQSKRKFVSVRETEDENGHSFHVASEKFLIVNDQADDGESYIAFWYSQFNGLARNQAIEMNHCMTIYDQNQINLEENNWPQTRRRMLMDEFHITMLLIACCLFFDRIQWRAVP